VRTAPRSENKISHRAEEILKVILVHHVDALKAEQDPQRHISPKGHAQAERLAARFKALGL